MNIGSRLYRRGTLRFYSLLIIHYSLLNRLPPVQTWRAAFLLIINYSLLNSYIILFHASLGLVGWEDADFSSAV